MSTPLKQDDGPSLGTLPTGGTEMLDPMETMKMQASTQTAETKLTFGKDFVSLKKKQKHFDDGPLPPLSPSQDQGGLCSVLKTPNLSGTKKGFLPLLGTYVPGCVKRTTKVAVVDLAENVDKLPPGTTGAIVEEGCEPSCDEYTEGTHFFTEKAVPKGSFGSGDVCVDVGMSGQYVKRFFRKTMVKENFRSSEVTVPINLNHENVTRVFGMIVRKEQYRDPIVELMIEPAGMSLSSYTQKWTSDTPRIWHITKQILAGLKHMHFYGMIHFDIKPENICIDPDNNLVKITDFGSAKLPTEPIQFVGWTPEYMCPETCQLFLQKMDLPVKVTDNDITGKVDVYAAALVIMYLYEKVHVLQRLITKGKTSYNDYGPEERKNLQIQLMKMLALDPNVIPCVMPDACDIDMRELIVHMTQHHHQYRFSAEDASNFIEKREKRKQEAIIECQKKLQVQLMEKARMRDSTSMIPFEAMVTEIPAIAYNCMDSENGPIKTVTKDRLRQKLMPYPSKGKSKGKTMKEETPVQELRRITAASKKMEDFPEPPTPVTDVSLSLARLNMQKTVNHTERNAVVTQPMADTQQTYRPSVNPITRETIAQAVMVPRTNRPENNKVLLPQPLIPTVTQVSKYTFPEVYQVQQVAQNSQQKTTDGLLAVMQQLLNKGLVNVQMTNRGPQLVARQPRPIPVTVNRSRVTPVMPASPPPPATLGETMTLCDEETDGNVPDFLKLG